MVPAVGPSVRKHAQHNLIHLATGTLKNFVVHGDAIELRKVRFYQGLCVWRLEY